MKIEKYRPNEKEIINFIKSDDELRLSASSNSGKGTKDMPYTLGEYIIMYLQNNWEGGYVEGIGYVEKDQSSVSFPDFNWESYFSDIFSFLSDSQMFPSGFSLPASNSSNISNNSSNISNNSINAHTEYRTVMLDGIIFDSRILILNNIALLSISATTNRELRNDEFYILIDNQEIGLVTDNYTFDGTIRKYIFPQIRVMYSNRVSLCKKNGECVLLL